MKIISELDKGIAAVPKTNVFVKQLDGNERRELLNVFQKLEKDGQQNDSPAYLVLFCACDSEGKRLFSADQIGEVLSHPAVVLDQIAEFALKHCGLDQEAVEREKKS